MSAKHMWKKFTHSARISIAMLATLQLSLGGAVTNAAPPNHDQPNNPKTPIKHVDNLLSKHIINEDGTPGPKFWLATQYSADITGATEFQLSPANKTAYSILPAPLNGGPTDVCANNGICSLADAKASENGLPDDTYYGYLTTGGSGLSGKVPDTRITGVNVTAPYSSLPAGPFQL